MTNPPCIRLYTLSARSVVRALGRAHRSSALRLPRPWPPCGTPVAPAGRETRVFSSSDGNIGVPIITSPKNPLVKRFVKLRSSAAQRTQEGSVVVTGEVMLRELLDSLGPELRIKTMLCSEEYAPEVRSEAAGPPSPHPPRAASAVSDPLPAPPPAPQEGSGEWEAMGRAGQVIRCSRAVLGRAAGIETADTLDVIAEVGTPARASLGPGWGGTRVLALDRVQDPGNLGTLLRTAAAFGWDAVYLLPGCCDPFNDKALRASRGAAFKLALAGGDVEGLRGVAREHQLAMVAAAVAPGGGTGRGGGGRARGLCLVMGSEGQGLSEEVAAACQPVEIPMSGDMESLNVGVAGGILMFALGAPGAVDQLRAQAKSLGAWGG